MPPTSPKLEVLATNVLDDRRFEEAARRIDDVLEIDPNHREALCHRAGIMVAGKLRCLGPIQRLKSEHGAGYSLDLRVGGDGAIDAVRKLIERRVPDATLKEECATRLRYGLPSSAVASVFALLEDKSNEGLVQDYQLGQTTLEEVFLRFAEGGEEDE